MRSVGIVAEFDPFHSGHRYLIDSVRNCLGPCAVVCVMSGDFVQRGRPAFFDKRVRAEAAVRCGADLVVELPFAYAVNGAGEFAKGAVRIMKGLGLSHIAFGSECGDEEKLLAASGEDYVQDKEHPNDLLAAEYLRQIRLQDAGLEPVVIRRVGGAHGGAPENGMASASWIREHFDEAAEYLPAEAADVYRTAQRFGPAEEKRYFDLVRYGLMGKPLQDVAQILAVSEGLENKLVKAAVRAEDIDSLIMAVKSKRYTYARISRILCQSLIRLDKETYAKIDAEGLSYAHVLAFNENGASFLKSIRKTASIPVITNVNSNLDDKAPQRLLLDIDIRAADIYSMLLHRDLYANSDRVQTVVSV